MSSNDDLEAEEIWGGGEGGRDQPNKDAGGGGGNSGRGGGESKEVEDEDVVLDDETLAMSTPELRQRIRLLDNEIRIMRSDIQRITHESRGQRDRINENMEKVKLNKQLPYLVGNVVEVLEPDAEDGMFAALQG